MLSYITAKTFPNRLKVTQEEISEIIHGPIDALNRSEIFKDDQDILDVIVDFAPATLAVDLARQLSKLEDIFMSKVEEDASLVTELKNLSSRVGTIRPTTEEEDKEVEVKSLQELAREALNNASTKK